MLFVSLTRNEWSMESPHVQLNTQRSHTRPRHAISERGVHWQGNRAGVQLVCAVRPIPSAWMPPTQVVYASSVETAIPDGTLSAYAYRLSQKQLELQNG